jgi:hypothetical protein
MRWQEEVTLTTYEMQWTVRYFSNNCNVWAKLQDIQIDTSAASNAVAGVDAVAGVAAGAVAYAKRKQWTWEQMRLKSDRAFTILNNAYKSPL